MDFESVSDELYAARREEFTGLRDERARQARPDRQLARRIAALRKPTVAAWLVNQVARSRPEEIDRLTKLGADLREAHQRLAGAELRRLSQQRHELVGLLVRRAQWLARKAGYPVGDSTQRQLGDTFEAAVSDADAAEAVRAARLTTSLAPGAAEEWFTAATVAAKTPVKTPAKTPVTTAAKTAVKTRPTPRKARAAREKARAEAAAAEQAVARAEQALREAERDAEQAAERVAELRARLAEAEQTEREKRAAVTATRRAASAARRTATAAVRRATGLA